MESKHIFYKIEEHQNISLSSLPWESVLFPSLLPLLSPCDWISLSQTSKLYQSMIHHFTRQNRRLVLRKEDCLSQQNFLMLTQDSTCLKHLSLRSISWVTDHLLRPVLKLNPNLICLELAECQNCSEATLHMVSLLLPRLQYLVVSGCWWVTPDALNYLHYFHQPTACSGLDTLKIIRQFGLRSEVEEKRIKYKSNYCGKDNLYRNLQCGKMVKKLKMKLQKIESKPEVMQEINISGCQSISDQEVINIVSLYSAIKFLNIGNNPLLTDKTMKAIATHLKGLRTLDISSCLRMTDCGLYTVFKHCPQLRVVHATGCSFSSFLLSELEQRGVCFLH